jgi:hypothetical protein
VVVVLADDQACSPRKSVSRLGLFAHAELLSLRSTSDIFEIFHWKIFWSSAERGDFMTDLQFSTKICCVSSFFESILH